MSMSDWSDVSPDEVLDFWFPDDGHWNAPDTHMGFWGHRMRGGVDDEICARFRPLAEAAARGFLDHWDTNPRGRLALVIALDQFSRSAFRETPAAFGQDIKSANLCCAALDDGSFDALPNVWEKQFMLIAIGHAEGPEHLQRIERTIPKAVELVEQAPPHLSEFYLIGADQSLKAFETIQRFGRHPHRNAVLGRISTPEEESYVATGKFPHNRELPEDREQFTSEIEHIRARLDRHFNR